MSTIEQIRLCALGEESRRVAFIADLNPKP